MTAQPSLFAPSRVVAPKQAPTLEEWIAGRINPGARSRWRAQARAAMVAAVDEYLRVVSASSADAHSDPDEIMSLVDDAYPFGERSNHPYKAWLAERKILKAILFPDSALPEPTIDDHGACLAAIDLVELGRVDEAVVLLADQAPHRLNRKCPTCGALSKMPCFEIDEAKRGTTLKEIEKAISLPAEGPIRTHWMERAKHGARVELIIPHEARVLP